MAWVKVLELAVERTTTKVLFVDLDSQDNCFYFKALQYGKLGGKNEKNNSFRVV